MSGIMFGAMLNGLGQGAESIGKSMDSERLERERLAERRALQEDRQLQQRELLAARQGSSGGGGGGGGSLGDIAPGSDVEAARAGRMGMDVPAASNLLAAQKSGDWSRYETPMEPAGPHGMGPQEATAKGLSAATKDWIKEKRAVLAEITDERTFNANYDDVVKGRQSERDNKVRGGIMGGNPDAATVARAYAATKGEAMVDNLGDKGTFDKFGKGQTLNDIGKSAAEENRAQAKGVGEKQRDDTRQAISAAGVGIRAAAKTAALDLKTFDEQNGSVHKWSKDDAKTEKQKNLFEQRARLVDLRSTASESEKQNNQMMADYISKKSDQPTPDATKPAAKQNPESPKRAPPDGTSLWKGGVEYVVKNGLPVRKN